MESKPHISVRLDGEETSIEFPAEGVTTSAAVSAVGNNLYRLDSVPLFVASATFADIIEAEQLPEGRLRFTRVSEKSGWQVFNFVVPRELIDSNKLAMVLAHADRLGAHWERVFGGLLFICVPPGVDWNPTCELKG
jgi:hypothetical protein